MRNNIRLHHPQANDRMKPGEGKMEKVRQILKEIDSLGPKERGRLIQALFAKGLITPKVDPFALLRENLPKDLSEKKIGEILDDALHRVRHAGASPSKIDENPQPRS
jgi:hypothetical protein